MGSPAGPHDPRGERTPIEGPSDPLEKPSDSLGRFLFTVFGTLLANILVRLFGR